MRKLFFILFCFFTIFSVVFAVLPLGTLALLPIGLALLLGFLALQKSNENQKKIVKFLILIPTLSLIAVVAKELIIKDEVEKDVQFEKVKIESKKEDKKDLEELENDLE